MCLCAEETRFDGNMNEFVFVLWILDIVDSVTQRERSLSTVARGSYREARPRNVNFDAAFLYTSFCHFLLMWNSVKWIVQLHQLYTWIVKKTSMVSGDRLAYWNQTIPSWCVFEAYTKGTEEEKWHVLWHVIHTLSSPHREGIVPVLVRLPTLQLPPNWSTCNRTAQTSIKVAKKRTSWRSRARYSIIFYSQHCQDTLDLAVSVHMDCVWYFPDSLNNGCHFWWWWPRP